jgi:hypothetical protein
MNITFGQNASLTLIIDTDKELLLFKTECIFKIAGF